MAQWANTVYTEYAPESPNERFGLGSSALTRQFDIIDGSFKGRMQAAYDFLGYAQIISTGSTGIPYYIHRVPPMPYPALSSASFSLPLASDQTLAGAAVPDMTQAFWANGISRTQQLGTPAGTEQLATPPGTAAAKYKRARLTVEFSTLPFQVKPDSAVMVNGSPNEGYYLEQQGWAATRYITRHIEPFSRLIKIPYGMMQANGKETKVGLPYREGGANVTYTWMRVPLTGGPFNGVNISGVNFTRIGKIVGLINGQTFDVFPARTLLLDSFSTREYQGAFGERLADVTFNMIYLPHPSTGKNFNGGLGPAAGDPQGWNTVYDLGNGKVPDYYAVTAPDGVSPPFTVVSSVVENGASLQFRDLFRP